MSEQFLTREQRYASAVYKQVQTCISNRMAQLDEQDKKSIEKDPAKDPFLKAYGALAHKLPILIRTAGLTQSLAFIQARNKLSPGKKELAKEARILLVDDIRKILVNPDIGIPLKYEQDLLKSGMQAPFDEYILLTEACMEALLWFKRFATSELGVEQDTEEEEQ